MSGPTVASSAPLKHLGVVPNSLSQATNFTNTTYKTARKYVPGVVEPYVKSVEDLASTYGAPVVTAASDYGSKVLQTVDGTVDTHVRNVSGVVSLGQEVHAQNYQHFVKAKKDYFGLVEQSFDYLKQLLNPIPYVNAILDPIRSSIRKTLVASDPDAALDWVFGRVNKVASISPVNKALKITEPYQKKTVEAAGSLVASPYYKQVADTTYSVASKGASLVSSTWAYKKGAEILWPQVAFVAEPVAEKLQKSKYVKDALSAVKPKAA